ncbi:MAG: FHA domain-containing protein [Myxococcales bacterium]|nr:FHA domain-containing protein [Myxococcales bacterium]
MIICPNCSRENEDHYKFCLGCGTELSKAAAAKPKPAPVAMPVPTVVPAAKATPQARSTPQAVPMARPASKVPTARPEPTPPPVTEPPPEDASPTLMGDAPSFDTSEPPTEESEATEPPVAADAEADDEALAPQATPAMVSAPPPPVAAEPEPEPEADRGLLSAPPAAARPAGSVDLPFDVSMDEAPDAPGPASSQHDEVPDASIRGMPRPQPVAQGPGGSIDARLCGSCGAMVPDGFKFCGVCGTRYEPDRAAPEVFVPQVQDAPTSAARLVLIHPDGSEGTRFPLSSGETTVGRSHPASLFAEDPFLSPRHATFYFVRGQLFVRDEGSLNGVFLRIKAEVELFHWDMLRIGQQLLRFEEMSQVRPVMPGAGDGTTVMGSPVRGAWGRLATAVAIDTTAAVWVLRKPEEFIGRERGDILFNEDGFVSGAHAKVSTREGRYFLSDLDSTNGTYLRIKGEGIVARGDLLLLGQQLFKVEID